MIAKLEMVVRANPASRAISLPARLAHDLTQPVSALALMAQYLQTCSPELLPASLEKVTMLSRSLTELSAMLAALREFMRHEDLLTQPPLCQPVALPEVVRALAESMPVLVGKKVVLGSAAPLSVLSSPVELNTLLAFLYKNALTHARAEIRLAAGLRDGRGVIEVADDGPGIPPNVMAQLGMPFVRGESGGGLGLGLHLAARIARQLDHSLSIETSAQGTRVILSLPCAAESARPSVGNAGLYDALRGKRLLVVDPDQAFGAALIKVVHAWQGMAQSVCSFDAPAARDFVTGGLDLVLCDAEYWRSAGNQFAVLGWTMPIGLVLISAHEMELPECGGQVGPQVFLRRPFSPLRLRRQLLAVLAVLARLAH